MRLLGVDVGFSATSATTGIACLDGDRLTVERTGTDWAKRRGVIPPGFHPETIALDGPLLPAGTDPLLKRPCEFLFSRAPFHSRCKPGLSHVGYGLALRQATAAACGQFASLLPGRGADERVEAGAVLVGRDGPVVEAFPNAFLGVLALESDFQGAPVLSRGRRFDWLYDCVAASGRVRAKLSPWVELPTPFWSRIESEQDHERRAALICLLTAALAHRGRAAAIGEPAGGWLWLPPCAAWETWAQQGLERAALALASTGMRIDPAERHPAEPSRRTRTTA
jgi:hypothetical protein